MFHKESLLFCIRSRVRHFYWYADCDLHQFCLEASRKEKQAEIKEDLVVLKERETELKTMLEDVQEEISKQQEQK